MQRHQLPDIWTKDWVEPYPEQTEPAPPRWCLTGLLDESEEVATPPHDSDPMQCGFEPNPAWNLGVRCDPR